MKRILPYVLILFVSACWPFSSDGSQTSHSNNRALVTGTWNGSSISRDSSLSTPTRFVLIQEGDKITGEFYLQDASGSLVKYGDVQGVIQQGVWGEPLQSSIVIYYEDYSYTKYTGRFIGDVFQGQYEYLDRNSVVQSFGQAELSLSR